MGLRALMGAAVVTFPWRLVGIGVAGIALLAVLWWAQARIRVSYQAELERDTAIANLATYQHAVETAARVAAAQQAADQKADAALASRIAALQADNEALRRLLSLVAPTVERTDAQGQRSAAINPVWWLCLSAQLSRDPTDHAACQARAGDGRMPDAISH